MGEFLKIAGTFQKIGVRENLYYARFEQMALEHQVRPDLETSQYLSEYYFFRFPFPDEDEMDIGSGLHAQDFQRRELFYAKPPFIYNHFTMDSKAVLDDKTVVNYTHLCPLHTMGHGFNVNGATLMPFTIGQQLIKTLPISFNHESYCLATVIECPFCKSRSSLSPTDVDFNHDINVITEAVEGHNPFDKKNRPFYKNMAARLRWGYSRECSDLISSIKAQVDRVRCEALRPDVIEV